MPVELAISIVVPVIKGNGDIRICSCYGAMKLLYNQMKVVEMVLEIWFCRIVTDSEIEFGFMSENATIYGVFILRRIHGDYSAIGNKLYICFVELLNAFDRVPGRIL